jgi:hypothetical protein
MGVGLVAGGANPVVRRALSAAMPLVPRVGIVLLSTLNYTAALLVLVVAVARLRNAMSTRHE